MRLQSIAAAALGLLMASTAAYAAELELVSTKTTTTVSVSTGKSVKKQTLKRTIDDPRRLAAVLGDRNRGETYDVIEVTCQGDDSEAKHLCSTTFVDSCDDLGGGSSTNPDGSITCTVNE